MSHLKFIDLIKTAQNLFIKIKHHVWKLKLYIEVWTHKNGLITLVRFWFPGSGPQTGPGSVLAEADWLGGSGSSVLIGWGEGSRCVGSVRGGMREVIEIQSISRCLGEIKGQIAFLIRARGLCSQGIRSTAAATLLTLLALLLSPSPSPSLSPYSLGSLHFAPSLPL